MIYLQLCSQRLCTLAIAGQDPHVLSFNVYLTNSFEDLYACLESGHLLQIYLKHVASSQMRMSYDMS